jgi:hypothetical protein
MTENQEHEIGATLADILGRKMPDVTAPSVAERAKSDTERLVSIVCDEALKALQARRDEIDNLMAKIHERKRILVDDVGDFAKFSCAAITVSEGIEKALEIISEPFTNGNPPATITSRNGNGSH